MKECKRCHKQLEEKEFYPHARMKDGRLNICRTCKRKEAKEYRALNVDKVRANDCKRYHDSEERRAYSRAHVKKNNALFPGRKSARMKLWRAVRSGAIVRPSSCEVCGTAGKLHGHHNDYTAPLSVVWVCPSCHSAIHNGGNQ